MGSGRQDSRETVQVAHTMVGRKAAVQDEQAAYLQRTVQSSCSTAVDMTMLPSGSLTWMSYSRIGDAQPLKLLLPGMKKVDRFATSALVLALSSFSVVTLIQYLGETPLQIVRHGMLSSAEGTFHLDCTDHQSVLTLLFSPTEPQRVNSDGEYILERSRLATQYWPQRTR